MIIFSELRFNALKFFALWGDRLTIDPPLHSRGGKDRAMRRRRKGEGGWADA